MGHPIPKNAREGGREENRLLGRDPKIKATEAGTQKIKATEVGPPTTNAPGGRV